MVHGVIESLLDAEALEKLLRGHAPEQYTVELTIDAVVNLLIQVSAGPRALVEYILERVRARDLLIVVRNFTTTGLVFGIGECGGCFVGRQHKTNLPVTPVDKLIKCAETGRIY